MPANEPAVALRDLRFRYPGASQDTLQIPALQISGHGVIALTGPSGAGKTTLIELLAGTLREPYEGSAQVLGTEVQALTRDAERQRHIRRIGLIPQDYGLLPGRTIEEILAQDLADAQIPSAEHADRVAHALAQVSLGAFAGRLSERLSGGQRQRVAIARMLARDVDLVIADEPTANLDPQLVGETLALFRTLGERVPVIIVTHDGAVAEQCDRTIVLQAATALPEAPPARSASRMPALRRGVSTRAGLVAALAVVLIGSLLGGIALAHTHATAPSSHYAKTAVRAPQLALPRPAATPRTVPTASPTAPLAPVSAAPPGIWCPVQNGAMPLVAACEIYPSSNVQQLPNSEALAGTPVGAQLGTNTGLDQVSGSMSNPWAVVAYCATDNAGTPGIVRILLQAYTTSGVYYSWGDEPCGAPSSSQGDEYVREASVNVVLSAQPITNNVSNWYVYLMQL